MQQRRVVGVLQVLELDLPVGADALARITEDNQAAAVENAVEIGHHLVPEIVLERRHVMVEGGEDDAATGRHLQGLQAVFLHLEVGRHAALFIDATAERYRDQVAREVVGPLVIGADELRRVAVLGITELGAAMGTAVDDHIHRAVGVAHVDHRLVAHETAPVIAGLGNLAFEADKIVAGPAEDHIHLAGIHLGV